jgi:hypothetical protein
MAGYNDNLIPAKKGEVRNPKGKPKGTKHLSTLIRDIGDNIDWSKTTLKNKDQMKQLYGNNGWKAIVYVAMTKAMAGDPQAMKWLAENGFGKNIDITTNGKDIPIALVEFVGEYDKDQD